MASQLSMPRSSPSWCRAVPSLSTVPPALAQAFRVVCACCVWQQRTCVGRAGERARVWAVRVLNAHVRERCAHRHDARTKQVELYRHLGGHGGVDQRGALVRGKDAQRVVPVGVRAARACAS
jgi:hypothetical protein